MFQDEDDDDDCLLGGRDHQRNNRESRSVGTQDDSDGGELLVTEGDGRVVGFPGMEELLPLIKDVLKQIVPLHREEESKMEALMADVGERDLKHRETVSTLERETDAMFQRLKVLESTVTRSGRVTGQICAELMAADAEMGVAQSTMRQVCDKGGVSPLPEDDFYDHQI
ncbi:hypothetical protein CBR_g24150 [Chara braunii]|uniref:Uncharacterized protein n=1 Tax=Chara braunii TaxID=69332 RepID=A0A388L674_CHABU|nr:hypothetical protein CBR_g24150 [Chara braunii]|eukprot:GBG77703.1 hypothetical protein CBR_g24150 [Chara braunii]